jgi:hypothetical protein
MANRISDPVITRRGDVVPGDKQDQPADGQTSTVSFTDGTAVNWWDACQHAFIRMAADLGRVGPLQERPSAGSDNPVWWLVTDGDAGPFWTYNDGSQWIVMDQWPDGITVGEDPTETVSGASASLGFKGNAQRDVHLQTDLVVSNPSGSPATEDVTVTLYDGTDNTGTELATETKTSGSVDAGSTASLTFIASEEQLDDGDYFLEVTFSGSTLEVDTLDEKTAGATYRFEETADGTGQVTDTRRSDPVLTIDPLTGAVDFPNGATGTSSTELANGEATLSSGSTTVDTGVSTSTDSGYFVDVALRPEDGADVAASLEDDSGGSGNWVLHLEENTTSVGNPTVGWQLRQT